jgi:hypothetical protein
VNKLGGVTGRNKDAADAQQLPRHEARFLLQFAAWMSQHCPNKEAIFANKIPSAALNQ